MATANDEGRLKMQDLKMQDLKMTDLGISKLSLLVSTLFMLFITFSRL